MPRVYPPLEQKPTTADASSSSITEAIAGFTSGLVSTLVVHPIDVVKTRLQVDQGTQSQFGTVIRIAKDLYRNEGYLTGFYRGLTPNLIGNSVSWSIYFVWYANIKDMMQKYRGSSNLKSIDHFSAAGAAGILTAVFTNPIWVIKTRMLSSSRNTPGAYKTTAEGARQVWRTEGVRGFYRGLLPSFFGVSHGAVQFMAYERLKTWRAATLAGHSIAEVAAGARSSIPTSKVELSNWDYLITSGASKMFAGIITYPYQVVRARLQTYDADLKYSGATDVVKKVWAKEGITGFYKGLGPNIIRVLPATCTTFLVYENLKSYLPKMWNGDHLITDNHAET